MFDSVAAGPHRHAQPVTGVRPHRHRMASSGVRTKLRTKSASHSKPPVANTTPWRAETSNGPSADSRRTPTTRPSRMTSSRSRGRGPRLDRAVEHTRSSRPMRAWPDPSLISEVAATDLCCGNPVESGVPERGLAHRDPRRHLGTDADPRHPRAELVEWKQRTLQRASALRLPARMLGVVVGEAFDDPERHRRVGLQPRDRDPGLDSSPVALVPREDVPCAGSSSPGRFPVTGLPGPAREDGEVTRCVPS